MKKIILPLVLLLIIIVGAILFQGESSHQEKEVLIVTSFYPLFELSSTIGGERVEVVNLTPPGVDPHDFEPSLKDLSRAESADIFIYNGGGLDPWAERKEGELSEKGVLVLNMSSYFHLLDGYHHHEEEDEQHNDEDHHVKDPHFWLDPLMISEIEKIILSSLIQVDPLGEDYYRENSKKTTALIEELHNRYKVGLGDCRLKSVVISHASLGYLAKRYNFEMISISGISPLEEPSPAKLAEITKVVKNKGIKHIFFETTIPTTLAETIAKETGAETLTFNPIASPTKKELDEGDNYFSLMRENLEKLRTALNCR